MGREGDEQANESDSFPGPAEPATSKHEQRAPRQSQLKTKVKGKDSAVQMVRTDMLLLAPKQQLPRHWCEQACFSSWRQISDSKRMRNICKNGSQYAREADLAQLRRGALNSSPFLFFVTVGAIFFNAPFLVKEEDVFGLHFALLWPLCFFYQHRKDELER